MDRISPFLHLVRGRLLEIILRDWTIANLGKGPGYRAMAIGSRE